MFSLQFLLSLCMDLWFTLEALRLDTKDQQCLALMLLINQCWELEKKWFSFALSARLHLPSWFWWLLILLMVVNVIKNQWKRGRVTDSRTWPRVLCSSRYPSIFCTENTCQGARCQSVQVSAFCSMCALCILLIVTSDSLPLCSCFRGC